MPVQWLSSKSASILSLKLARPTLNIQKITILHQPAPAAQHCTPAIKIHDETLENVQHFTGLIDIRDF